MSFPGFPDPSGEPVNSDNNTCPKITITIYQNGGCIRTFSNVKDLNTGVVDRITFTDRNGNEQCIINKNGIIIIETEHATEDISVDAK